ncbi:MAG: cyclic nucleotide-binding domain-containing protein [Magnetococcales bacterium]|nr:cyclic nucleotide-binding domain-containing protein [Magnetococcales bacterium]
MFPSFFRSFHAIPLRTYRDGQVVLMQGDTSSSFGLLMRGQVEVYHKTVDGEDTVYRVLQAPDIFGIHSLMETMPRHSGIRALGTARILLLDRVGFLRTVHEHPQMAFQVLKKVSLIIKRLSDELKQRP